MTEQEGYIKFTLDWQETDPLIPVEAFVKLNAWREILYNLDMIGADSQGIGFGNISVRDPGSPRFYITGSATGKERILGEEHYCLVTGFDLERNALSGEGPVKPSAESMSHAVIYAIDPGTNAVIHIHHKLFWEKLLYQVPTTPETAEYGTPEMAEEIKILLANPDNFAKRVVVMAGHPDGIIFFGKDLDEAGAYTLSYFNEVL